jgi:signal transduction histidine kinase
MNLARVTLRPLLERVCEELEEPIRRGRLSVRMELGVDEVQAEREGLREALVNLVGNAVKFSRPEGGTITIGSRAADDSVILSVADTGIGFDMKYHDRIFGIFERLHRPGDYPGTGVGLAIVRKIADRHGGRVWADSAPGKGSAFHLALPMGDDGAAPTADAQGAGDRT